MPFRVISGVALIAAVSGAATAAELLGASFRAPDFVGPATLYDVNTSTGLATNGRAMNLDGLVGLSFHDGVLWGLTDQFASYNGAGIDTGLLTIDIATGQATLLGELGEIGGFLPSEGDLDFHAQTGRLYGVTSQGGSSILYEIDPVGVSTSVIGSVDAEDLSAMAFDASGNLWALDTSFEFDPTARPGARLLRLDVSTGAVLEAIQTDVVLGTVAGMDFDPDSGRLFIADGDFIGTNNLYTADFVTGTLDLIGSTGLDGAPTGFGGLAALAFVPAPGVGAVLGLGLLSLGRRRR